MLFRSRRLPLIAYRYWLADDNGLRAPYRSTPWPEATFEAYCSVNRTAGRCRQRDCSCGVYAITRHGLADSAFLNLADGRMMHDDPDELFGAVLLHGRRTHNHTSSVRSERATVAGLLRSLAPAGASDAWQQKHDQRIATIAERYSLPVCESLADLYLAAVDLRGAKTCAQPAERVPFIASG
jgi:hypothetical protein